MGTPLRLSKMLSRVAILVSASLLASGGGGDQQVLHAHQGLRLQHLLLQRPLGGYGMDWFDAMQCCYFQNSYLAEPQNQEETDKINTYLTISTGGDRQNTWWMGATDMHHEGGWSWMSGAPWSFENWNEGEPNQNGNEDCGAFDSQADGFKWMDLECNSANHGVPHYAVCEKMIA